MTALPTRASCATAARRARPRWHVQAPQWCAMLPASRCGARCGLARGHSRAPLAGRRRRAIPEPRSPSRAAHHSWTAIAPLLVTTEVRAVAAAIGAAEPQLDQRHVAAPRVHKRLEVCLRLMLAAALAPDEQRDVARSPAMVRGVGRPWWARQLPCMARAQPDETQRTVWWDAAHSPTRSRPQCPRIFDGSATSER